MPARVLSRRRFLGLVAAAAAGSLLPWRPAPAEDTFSLLLLSDVHFDPFAKPELVPALQELPASQWNDFMSRAWSGEDSLGDYGQETGYLLWESGLMAMRLAVPSPAAIVFTGDFLRHDFSDYYWHYAQNPSDEDRLRFIVKTVAFFAHRLQSYFPGVPVFFTLGNNDAGCGDYRITPGQYFLTHSAATYWSLLNGLAGGQESFSATFALGGWYALDWGDLRLISLNTVYYSPKWQAGCGAELTGDPAETQMSWLEAELAQARSRGRPVWLVLHIPPGVDVYATMRYWQGGELQDVTMMWREPYNSRFLALMDDYHDVLAACFAGHTHMDDWRLPSAEAGLMNTPALNCLYGNNPGFVVLTCRRGDYLPVARATWRIDMTQGAVSRQVAWGRSYSFTRTYGVSDLTASSLARAHQALREDSALAALYRRHYIGGHMSSAFPQEQLKAYWCGQAYLTEEDYRQAFNSLAWSRRGSVRRAA